MHVAIHDKNRKYIEETILFNRARLRRSSTAFAPPSTPSFQSGEIRCEIFFIIVLFLRAI